MKNETTGGREFNMAEARFMERLRHHPELMTGFQSILELTRNAQGPLKTADAVEELLIQELRQLGNASMNQWATRAEQRVSDELKEQEATGRSRKKNTDVVVCLWVGEREGSDLAQPEPELPPSLARTIGSHTPRKVAAAGSCADGLWLRTFVCAGGGQCPGTLWF